MAVSRVAVARESVADGGGWLIAQIVLIGEIDVHAVRFGEYMTDVSGALVDDHRRCCRAEKGAARRIGGGNPRQQFLDDFLADGGRLRALRRGQNRGTARYTLNGAQPLVTELGEGAGLANRPPP